MCRPLVGEKKEAIKRRNIYSKMEVESVLVTGANRGIGLEFVKQLVRLRKPPKFVFATYRSEGTIQALEEIRDSSLISQVILIQMDIRKPDDLKATQQIVEDTVKDKGLMLLINNAVAVRFAFFPEVTDESMQLHFATNTTGPLMLLKEMLPLLQKAAARKETGMSASRAAVLNISSTAGSCGELKETEDREWLRCLDYRASKAALNMSMRVAALTIKEQGILIVQMCPGWVKTDDTEDGLRPGQITPTESVSCMLNTLTKLSEKDTGAFVDRDGNTIPF